MNVKDEEKNISAKENKENVAENIESNVETNKLDEVNKTETINNTQQEEKPNKQLVVSPSKEFVPVKEKTTNKKKMSIFSLIIILVICLFLLSFFLFTAYNIFNTNIISGVHIKGIDVSNMSTSDAKYKLDNYLKAKLPEEITLVHGDYKANISISQINAYFDTKNAVNSAYNVGRQGNIFENNIYILSNMFGYSNIEPAIKLDKTQLSKNLEEISANLPDKVTESSYYIEGSQLIITSGKDGNVVDTNATINVIKEALSDFSAIDKPIEIIVKSQSPQEINVEKIHEEIYKEPVDAYYTKEPFTVYPSENGVDFKVSMEEAKAIVSGEKAEEYTIPLNITTPNVTTNMIGTEAFPDMLSSFSTRYTGSANRTTNLILAANKINGTVLMPGETFSYNKTVGARTIAAGYREAPIYVSGKVVDGVGGGICQIATTLYNAVVYSNLEIVQRTNHQFVPSYAPASRDATVVYGAIDFQFKNNRTYPIKIVCSVAGGIANFQIFGLRQDDDCEVEISAYQTGTTATAIYSEAYKILKKDGAVVSKELLSKDVYKRH
jgi:vancomycin resistance protein YoaR